jgi:hypothetical protein
MGVDMGHATWPAAGGRLELSMTLTTGAGGDGGENGRWIGSSGGARERGHGKGGKGERGKCSSRQDRRGCRGRIRLSAQTSELEVPRGRFDGTLEFVYSSKPSTGSDQ